MRAFLLATLLLFITNAAQCQTFDAFYASMADDCNQDTITEYLQQFEDLGIKELQNPALNNTKDWIIQKYQNWGYTNIVEDDFVVQGTVTTNVIVTKTGTLYPDTYVIIDGHYDTKNGPGTNDNGSGTVILLELARLIKDIPTEYSIKFIHFSAEEVGLEGSEHYVTNVANPSNLDVKLVLNIDQVGGTAGETNNIITCERDQTPPNENNAQSDIYTNELATCVQLYSNLQTQISFAYGSDYVPFMLDGYVVTGLYEENESPYPHSINDSMIHVDLPYLYQVTKASMGALLHFAVAHQELDVSALTLSNYTFAPNPAKDFLTISFKDDVDMLDYSIVDLTGATIESEKAIKSNGTFKINIQGLPLGTYLLYLNTPDGNAVHHFVKR